MTNSQETFLVTGAAGCIGAWAIRLLLDQGVRVVASDLSDDLKRLRLISEGRDNSQLDFVTLDVTETEEVARVIAEREVTHVVHLAGLQMPFCAANPPLGAMVNVVGTVNIFEGIRRSGRTIGLAYASSAAVFGASGYYNSGVVGDASGHYADTFYGVYKVANEGTARLYSMSHGIGSVGLRPFIIYGPGRDQGKTSDPTKAVLAALRGESFEINFGGNLLLTYAPDCADAFIRSARAAAGSGDAICLNVPGRRVGVAQFVSLLEELVPESAGKITHLTAPLAVPALLSDSALEAVIGEVANRPLREGLEETIAIFRGALAAGLLPPSES
jgi:nucleoside-diphosphate-sugar epimerase